MNVKELRKILNDFDDDDVVLVESENYVTNIDDVDDASFLIERKIGSFETYETENNSWDSTKKFRNAKRCALITCEAYYIKANESFTKLKGK